MKQSSFLTVCKDFLLGAAVGELAVLFCAIAFGASGGQYYFGIAALVVFLAAAVRLLRTEQKQSRIIRGVTAVLGFLPLLMLDGRSGIDSTERMFRLMNTAYVREYGGPAIGNALCLVFLILPGTLLLILIAVFIARHLSAKQQNAHPTETDHV